jgi:hypothetical protein
MHGPMNVKFSQYINSWCLVACLSTQSTVFISRPVYVGFVIDKVVLRQVFLPVLQFYTISIILLMSHNESLIYSFTSLLSTSYNFRKWKRRYKTQLKIIHLSVSE